MNARINCGVPVIRCVCGGERKYPVAIGLPPKGTQSMCTACCRIWTLDGYSYVDGRGTRWAWGSPIVASADEPRVTLAPLVAEPPTEILSAIAASVCRAYERIDIPYDHEVEIEADEELTVLARFDARGGTC